MARSLVEIIKGLFESDVAVETESGQKVIGFDAILPEIEGLQLLDTEDVTGGNVVTPEETIEETVQYVSADELNNVIERLIALEQLIRVEENTSGNIEVPVVERW